MHRLHDYFFPHRRNNYRPHLFSTTSVAVLAIIIVVLEAGYLVQTKFVFLNTNFLASVLPSALVVLTNTDRTNIGVGSVTEDALLDQAAQKAAEDMAKNGYFAHVSPDGKTPWYWLAEVGYRYSYAGENLAVNFTDSDNVETAWMNSPTHHANIVKPEYTHVGFGTANGMYQNKETTFVVEFFATPAVAVAPKPIALAVTDTKPTPIEPASVSTTTSTTTLQVLGTQSPPTSQNVVSVGNKTWYSSLLASPVTSLETMLAMFFVFISLLLAIAVLTRRKFQHPTVVFGGAFLLLLISGAMLSSVALAGSVVIPANAVASVYSALP